MATSEIKTRLDAAAAFTCTLASLAHGSSRQVTLLSNSLLRPAALIYVKLTSGGSVPNAGATYDVFLLRSDNTIADDAAGADDAAITIENAPQLGSLIVTATAGKAFYGTFDTAALGPLGTKWGIAIRNSSGQALSATENTHALRYTYYVPEAQ